MTLEQILKKMFKENLTEKDTEEIKVLFESSVNEAVKKQTEEKTKELEESKTLEIENVRKEFQSLLDVYCDEVVKEFVNENAVAIESNTKIEMAELLIESLSNSFQKYNYPVEKETVDSIKTLESKVSNLEKKNNELINEKVEKEREIFELEKVRVFNELTEGMPLIQSSKLFDVVSELSCESIEEFSKKTKIFKENIIDGAKKEDSKEREKDKDDFLENHNLNDDDNVYDVDKYALY